MTRTRCCWSSATAQQRFLEDGTQLGRSRMSEVALVKTAGIRQLNDQLRRKGTGGRIVITRGIEALGPDSVREVLTAVARFDDFTEDNDPWGEHDCAVLTV